MLSNYYVDYLSYYPRHAWAATGIVVCQSVCLSNSESAHRPLFEALYYSRVGASLLSRLWASLLALL